MTPSSLPQRTQLPQDATWNAESVFADRAAWRAEARAVADAIPTLAARAGHLGEGAASLTAFLKDWGALSLRVETVAFYANMARSVDMGDDDAQALQSEAGTLYATFLGEFAFVEPELLALGSRLDAWRETLAPYRHYLDNLTRKAAHVRSAEVEQVLGLASDVFLSADDIHQSLVDADLKFAPASNGATVSQSTITAVLASTDREVRRTAWHSYCDAHIAVENTLASSLNTVVKRDVFLARARRFETSLDAALFEHAIPPRVFEQTLATFQAQLPVWHRYWRAKKKALGVETLHHWDIWAPVSARPPVVPFDQAVAWIAEAVAPLGRPYQETLRQGCLEQRWVDRAPVQGKGSGAFSYGTPLTHPFIMMSYTDDLPSVSTLTHELGHSLHSWHTWKAQPPVYSGYSMFVAEVASNFHQAVTRDYLFRTQADKQFQLALIDEAMENLHRYFFIMPTLARFEVEHHRRAEAGKGVTAADLNALMADLFTEGYGGELEVDREREGSTWAQFDHLYANYYVFQYATGISAAHALARPILAGDTEAARRYLAFLSAGSSGYPMDVLKTAGVDMTTAGAMEETFAVVSALVDRLEALTE